MKIVHQLLTIKYLTVFFILLSTNITSAAEPEWKPVVLNVPIGGVTQVDNFGYYFQLWYSFAIGAVGVLATVMIMWGGFKWLTSRGNSGTISESKQIIWSAIIGVVLAFLSYTILYLINPRLTTIGLPTLQTTNIDVTTFKTDIKISNNIFYSKDPITGQDRIWAHGDASPEQLAKAESQCKTLCVNSGYNQSGNHRLQGNRDAGFHCVCDITTGIPMTNNNIDIAQLNGVTVTTSNDTIIYTLDTNKWDREKINALLKYFQDTYGTDNIIDNTANTASPNITLRTIVIPN